MAFSVTLIHGLQPSARRAIAFLECTEDKEIDAKRFFDKLKPKAAYDFKSRFDHWLGGNVFDKYFHGWPNDKERKNCFVFKRKEAGTHHRLYGFLMNPKSTNLGYQVCVLVAHAQKNTEHTDPSELDAVNALRAKREVIEAVRSAFPG